MEKLDLSYIAGGNVKWYSHCGKVVIFINMYLSYNTANVLLGTYCRNENVFSQKPVEFYFYRRLETQKSFCQSMVKQTVVDPYNGILL